MSYTLTLGEARSDSGIRNVSSCCADSQLFADQVNAVTRRLSRRGGWFGLEQNLRICFQGCRVVWPRQVGSVLGFRPCRGGDIQLKNNFWSIYGYSSCGCGPPIMFDQDTAPTFREITGNEGKYLRWNVVKRNDVGKTMRVYGFQYGNQPLQEKNAAGDWIPGITITAAAPYAITTTLVTKITDIKIESGMQGMNYLYQVDPTSGDLLMLGEYQPRETSPSYRVSKINNVGSICATTDEHDRKMRYADALVKVAFVPAFVDEDFLMLSNIDALKLGIQALRAEEAGDKVAAAIHWIEAVDELNMELRDKFPNMGTVIRINSIGSHCATYNPI